MNVASSYFVQKQNFKMHHWEQRQTFFVTYDRKCFARDCNVSKLCMLVAFASLFFTLLNCCRGKGPLKNSSDVINAAKKIAEAGSRMDKLSRAVADQVVL